MEIRELRIGNWVYSQEIGKNVQISAINEDGFSFKDCVTLDYPSIEEIHPIPLTEEILLSCGFEKRGVIFRINNGSSHQFDVNYSPSRDIFYYDSSKYSIYTEVEIKHLHQLQNLYFALTGEELKLLQ